MANLTAQQVEVLMAETVDESGVDLAQIRGQLRLTPAQRVDWLLEALAGIDAFRQRTSSTG